MSLNTNVAAEINKAIEIAMCQIFHTGFGRFDSKKDFRIKFLECLKKYDTTWSWRSQASNPRLALYTDCLLNVRSVIPDCVGTKDGKSVLIELKYIPVKRAGQPQDPPAFTYDILKDCLKIELALDKKATSIDSVNVVYGVSIGVTNWQSYWNNEATDGRNGWARNAFEIMRNPDSDFPNRCHVVSRSSENYPSLVYANKRLHLDFNYAWQRTWIDAGNGFRYIMFSPMEVRRESEKENSSVMAGNQKSILPIKAYEYLPFVDAKAKEDYLRNHLKIKSGNIAE